MRTLRSLCTALTKTSGELPCIDRSTSHRTSAASRLDRDLLASRVRSVRDAAQLKTYYGVRCVPWLFEPVLSLRRAVLDPAARESRRRRIGTLSD